MKVYAVRHVEENGDMLTDEYFLKKETAKKVADEMRTRMMSEMEGFEDFDVFVDSIEVNEE